MTLQAIGDAASKIEQNITMLLDYYQTNVQGSVLKEVDECSQPGTKYDTTGSKVGFVCDHADPVELCVALPLCQVLLLLLLLLHPAVQLSCAPLFFALGRPTRFIPEAQLPCALLLLPLAGQPNLPGPGAVQAHVGQQLPQRWHVLDPAGDVCELSAQSCVLPI